MKMRLLVVAAGIGFMFLLFVSSAAEAAELKVLSGLGMQMIMEDLGPQFERATGHKLTITFGNGPPIVKRVRDGETVDVIVGSQERIMDPLVKDGRVVAGNVTVLARTGVSVAVRKGAPKPDISSPEALKRTLLAAKSVSYVPAGASGAHFAKVLDRLGIANEMKSKTVFPKGEIVGPLIANGEAEIGLQQTQQLVSFAGIEIVGPLPGDLQLTSVVSAAIVAGSKNSEASKVLVDFLRTPAAVAVMKADGMEPATP